MEFSESQIEKNFSVVPYFYKVYFFAALALLWHSATNSLSSLSIFNFKSILDCFNYNSTFLNFFYFFPLNFPKLTLVWDKYRLHTFYLLQSSVKNDVITVNNCFNCFFSSPINIVIFVGETFSILLDSFIPQIYLDHYKLLLSNVL